MNAFIKKITCALAGAVCLGFGTAGAAAAADVTVTLPTFPVHINGVQLDQKQIQYPFLVYKDITYVPMTYYDARLLGLETAWTQETGLGITTAAFVPDGDTARGQYVPYIVSEPNQDSYSASLAAFPITVQGTAIDNSTEEYPLLVFRDVTYFPLTWRFAVESFGWDYNFDLDNGLVITPVPTKIFDPFTVKVTGSVVNIRADAGTTYDVLTKVSAGDILTAISEKTNDAGERWYQIRTGSGATGWIADWLVTTDIASDTPSTVLAPPTTLSLLQMAPGENVSQLQLLAGEGTPITISNKTAQQVVITLGNNTLSNTFAPQSFGVGPLTAVTPAVQGERTVTLTLDLAPGSYCKVNQENDTLTISVHRRNAIGASGLAGKVIVLDPGHGNINTQYGTPDPGTIGLVLGYTDAEVGTGVSLKLQSLLQAQGATVILTRGAEPQILELSQRPVIANQNTADAFVSIHGNALKNNTTKSGAEVYYYGGEKSLSAAAQNKIRQELAEVVKDGILANTGRSTVVKTENFIVLRENTCPSILVECGYLSNAEDEALLATDAYQMQIAMGILQGLQNYFTVYQ